MLFSSECPLRLQLQELGILKEAEIDPKYDWMRADIVESQWANMAFQIFLQPFHFKKLELKIKRDNAEKEIEVTLGKKPAEKD